MANAAFGCPYLENVYYNATNADDSTAFVGGSAFTGAGNNGDGLKIRIGKNVERIPGSFLWTASFTGEQSNISSVVFEEGSVCKKIGGSAFRQVQFSTLELPDSVKTIGANCFDSSSLATLTANGVADVGDYAFNGCSQLQNIALTNVAHIGDWAFQNCSALQEISLDKITSIGTYAFTDCVSIKEITLPSSLQEMGDGAFYGCGGLERVTIEEGLKTIGSSVFNGCTSLEIVTIPESVTYIDAYAFGDCPITDVYYNGSAEQWAKIEINNTATENNSIINARKHFAK